MLEPRLRTLWLANVAAAAVTLEQSLGVRARLDEWGVLGRDYFVCRGNHDKPDEHRIDHWGTVFHARQRLVEYRVGELRMIGLDTTRLRGSGGTIVVPQLAHRVGPPLEHPAPAANTSACIRITPSAAAPTATTLSCAISPVCSYSRSCGQ
ncbi:hypothetical protein OIE68_39110 [Nocardia vinacea]|uniref:Uncharacterized protein n=1 Tax=Nocardia vinacea TaxID=96468 RepID=A0ABZ1YKV6_9NOCA|nr:hypothetical protein OIE68_39110 [Nocardia vinacea]